MCKPVHEQMVALNTLLTQPTHSSQDTMKCSSSYTLLYTVLQVDLQSVLYINYAIYNSFPNVFFFVLNMLPSC